MTRLGLANPKMSLLPLPSCARLCVCRGKLRRYLLRLAYGFMYVIAVNRDDVHSRIGLPG
jgi:hypothetical protein